MLDFELPTLDRKDQIVKRIISVFKSYKGKQDFPDDSRIDKIFLYVPTLDLWIEAAPP